MIYAWPFFSSQTEVASSFIAFCSRLLSNFKTPGQQTDFSSRVGPYQLQQPSEQILMGVNELFKKHSRVVMVFRVQQLLYSGLGVSILLLYFKTSYKNMMILKSESICHLMLVTDQLTRKTNPFLATSSPFTVSQLSTPYFGILAEPKYTLQDLESEGESVPFMYYQPPIPQTSLNYWFGLTCARTPGNNP